MNLTHLRILVMVACALLFAAGAFSLFAGIVLFFVIDLSLYLLVSHQEKQELERQRKEYENLDIATELEKLAKLDLSEIAKPTSQKGYASDGEIIGKFADEPIFENIRDVSTGEIYTYVGAITHTDVDSIIQKMMVNNKFEKAVRLESGLIYAKKET